MVKVKNARRGKLRLAFGVTLTPGTNEVDAAAWAQCKVHPITLHYVQSGDVTEAASASGSDTPSPEPLVERRAVHAEELPDPDAARYGEPESPPLPMPDDDLSEAAVSLDGPPPSQPTSETAECPVANAAAGGLPDLSSMRAKDAITALLTIDDSGTLKALLALEGRTTVIRAIMRRLGELGG